jgi:hypothetical protein
MTVPADAADSSHDFCGLGGKWDNRIALARDKTTRVETSTRVPRVADLLG